MMQQLITLPARGRGLYDISERVSAEVARAGLQQGMCNLFLQHTSASLIIQENADPDVLSDLLDWFSRVAPDGDPRHRHVDEGPDDMPAHVRTAITASSLSVPIIDGRLALGRWQGIYLFEHRLSPRARRLWVSCWG